MHGRAIWPPWALPPSSGLLSAGADSGEHMVGCGVSGLPGRRCDSGGLIVLAMADLGTADAAPACKTAQVSVLHQS